MQTKIRPGRPPIYYVGTYHPHHKGNNPKFDKFSGLVLDLKESKNAAIEHFAQLLALELGGEMVFAGVPSSNAAKSVNGPKRLAARLAQLKGGVDASGCLVRHTTVPKAASGGPRDIPTHLSSITVAQPHLVRGRGVWILDDVTTSGASLYACGQLLTAAGAGIGLAAVGLTDGY